MWEKKQEKKRLSDMEDTMRRPNIHQIRIPIRQVISSHLTIYQVMNTATPTTTLPLLQSMLLPLLGPQKGL